MKVVIINSNDKSGGAAIAANRLTKALIKSGISAKMLVKTKTGSDDFVVEKNDSALKRTFSKYLMLFEKVLFIPYESSKKKRFSFSTTRFGSSITNHKVIRDADIIHLHWVNLSFLSHKHLGEIFNLGKPVVITLHDMWYMTGGCHYAEHCTNYQTTCQNCFLLKSPKPNDLSHREFEKKKAIYNNKATIVGCSKWISDLAKESSLLGNNPITNIPNPIDTSVFCQMGKEEARLKMNLDPNKNYILYTAAKIDDERKGYKYLSQAFKTLHAEASELTSSIEIIIMGRVGDPDEIEFYFPTHFLGNLSDISEIVTCYNAANLFVAPSLEDNLPNTIIESMACGTPTVAFETGGIPEIIDHKINGYLSKYKDSNDLVNGIKWILSQPSLDQQCLKKVNTAFEEKVVAEKIIKLYKAKINF